MIFIDEDIVKDGLPVQTPMYRAPEVCCGDARYSYPCDSWSLGVTLAELFLNATLFKEAYNICHLLEVFKFTGTPTDSWWLNLPLFPNKVPKFKGQIWPPPWLPQWSGLQGSNFLSIFRGLLRLSPSLRWLPQPAQCSVFGKLLPTVLPGQLLSMAKGSRGATSVIQGSIEDTLLSWLQQDPAWSELVSEIVTAGEDHAERKVNLEKGGFVSLSPPVTKNCNTMDCSKLFFAQYVYGFGRALQNVNHDWLMQLTDEVRFRLSAIPGEELGENGRHFFNTSFCDTAFAYACAQVMLPGKRCDPAHFDDGASTLMGILTLYGDRSVHFEVDGAWLPSVVQQKPGSFFIGSLASVKHYVEHNEDHGPLYHEESDGQGVAEG